MPMKKVLAKCGGQVDFGEEGGSGWAQLVLPLRLLLFYKVGDRWKLYGGIDANYISGSTKECSIGKEADDTHRGESQFKMTL